MTRGQKVKDGREIGFDRSNTNEGRENVSVRVEEPLRSRLLSVVGVELDLEIGEGGLVLYETRVGENRDLLGTDDGVLAIRRA